MSAQITRRALSAGLGIGTLGILPQRATADTPFTGYAFAASGAPTPRTMPDRLAEIVNVKDFGAVGNGSTDDSAAIQAAIDAAFGPAGSPHGANAALNRPLFFPNGSYLVNTPLKLTQLRGACIYGAGQLTTSLSGPSGVFAANGMDYCRVENLYMSCSAGTGKVAFDLDWNGIGSVGLQGNMFTNCEFYGGDYGCRIGFSGYGGANNQFYACNFGNSGVAGFVTWSPGAMGQAVQGGGCGSSPTGFWVKAGQIASINDIGLAGNTVHDILMESASTLLVKGCRTESTSIFVKTTSTGAVVVIEGCAANLAQGSTIEFCHPAGTLGGPHAKVIIDACVCPTSQVTLCTDQSAQGSVYLRGNYFYDPTYYATVPNMGAVSFASGGTVTWTNHGITADKAAVVFSGSVPSGVSAGVTYYVIGATITANTFQISATPNGSSVSSGSGTCNAATLFLKGFAGSLGQRI